VSAQSLVGTEWRKPSRIQSRKSHLNNFKKCRPIKDLGEFSKS